MGLRSLCEASPTLCQLLPGAEWATTQNVDFMARKGQGLLYLKRAHGWDKEDIRCELTPGAQMEGEHFCKHQKTYLPIDDGD